MMFPKPQHKKKRKQRHFKTPAKDYCQYCGSTYMIDPPHHIIPKQMGGTNRPEVHSEDNAITLCRRCHDRAHGLGSESKLTVEQLRAAKLEDEARLWEYQVLIGKPPDREAEG